jgi:SAM-dependent methyltransferase
VSRGDGNRWDERYAKLGPPPIAAIHLPGVFSGYAPEFPSAGSALDLACGHGGAAVWLAQRGVDVLGVDVSAVAVAAARDLAQRGRVAQRCRFAVADLDDGLPPGPAVDAIVCNKFRDSRLYGAIAQRLAPGGLLAIAVLSEVGGDPGPFRAVGGELRAAFADLTTIAADEGEGLAWLLGRRA